MESRVTQPTSSRPAIDDSGILSNEMVVWVQTITNRTLIIGTGDPEGAVSASEGAEYQDRNGTAGNIRWGKRDNDILGDTTKGWIAY